MTLTAFGLPQKAFAAGSPQLNFGRFLNAYLEGSTSSLQAQQNFAQATQQSQISQDVSTGELSAQPTLSHEKRVIPAIPSLNTYNRALDVQGTYTQDFSTGSQVQVRAQEFIEQSNPLFQAYDRSTSVGLNQDLYNNGFGYEQRRRRRQGKLQGLIAQLELRQAQVGVCEEAFNLYTDAYVQQQRWKILEAQLKDAGKALANSRRLFRQRLMNRVDLLSSESDYIQTKNDVDQALQVLKNGQQQIAIYIEGGMSADAHLESPANYLQTKAAPQDEDPLLIALAKNRVASSEIGIERAKSQARNNLDLGVELGHREGRRIGDAGFNRFTEDYVAANMKFSIPTFNKSNPANINFALKTQRNAILSKILAERTQLTQIKNLQALVKLFNSQVTSSEKRLKLLKEKEDLAYNRMKSGRLEFENYLLHRDAFRTHQINHLLLLKDLWTNRFLVLKESASANTPFCMGQAS